MRFVCLAAAIAAGSVLVSAAVAAEPGLSVTIYANNQALVQDTRLLDLKPGRQTVEFKNVSAQIRPETVSLTATGLNIIEQNFDYDLLSPAKMMEKAVGHVVTLVHINPATGVENREQAEVLATNGGVVLKIGDQIEVLRDDGLPTRVIFDKLPDNLRASPTLSITLNATPGGSRPATLSYLTPSLGWRADYVALFDETVGKIDVQGWITLTNNSGTTYDNAKALLVAGNPTLIGQPGSYRPIQNQRSTVIMSGVESSNRERLGDYYLYPLAERTTIGNAQTKQVSFLDVHSAPASHGYEYRVGWLQTTDEPRSAQTVYRFSTSASGGLGDQLPAGVVRFYIRDNRGSPQFVGENEIGHTPMGSELSLATGDAFDVKVKSVVERREAINIFRWKTTMRYTVTNASPKPVTVALHQQGLWGDTSILSESQKSRRDSADEATWDVQIPANGKTDVTATFDTKF